MSLAQPAFAPERQPSPGPINLASNNPFRRAASPALPSPPVYTANNTEYNNRPMSRNPFLDPPANAHGGSYTAQRSEVDGLADELFKEMSVLDKPISNGNGPPMNGPARAGTMPVHAHRPSRSRDEDMRRGPAPPRGPPRPRGPPTGELGIFASPQKAENRRPRRNSESSAMERDRAEEDRRRRERRREREARSGRDREGRPRDDKSKPSRKPRGLDIIDKLDVTGIYGQGMIHHDGPFDACNPHRNRKKDSKAPMQAFPVGSANNAIGGSGPLNAKIDVDRFHGRGEDAFNDFAGSGTGTFDSELPPRPQKTTRQLSFNPTDRVEPVHGEETYGLGTSTHLEGAPASRVAVQRSESENAQSAAEGLTRKKSLAMRIRGMSQSRRMNDYGGGRVTSPEARYGPRSPDTPPAGPVSAGGPVRARYGPGQERNPFFNNYDDAYEKKGTQIKIAEADRPTGARAPGSPNGAGLTRSVTADSSTYAAPPPPPRDEGKPAGGFLNRMRSLKGGRRPRPEQRAG